MPAVSDILAFARTQSKTDSNGLTNANQLFAEIQVKEKALVADYGGRSKDDVDIIRMKKINYI